MALVAAGVAVVFTPLAIAGHAFTDVLDSSPFHDDIAAVRDAGITAGKTCDPPGTPPTFCPQEPITREAMAAFVHRGISRVGYDESPEILLPDAGVDLASVSLTTGGAPGGTGFVMVHGAATAYVDVPDRGCPCTAGFSLTREGDPAPVEVRRLTLGSPPVVSGPQQGFGPRTAGLEWVFPVETATTYTFVLRGQALAGTDPLGGYATLSAVYVPFGATGGNVLEGRSESRKGRTP